MKSSKITKIFSAGALALSLASLPAIMPASAQTNAPVDGYAVDSTANNPATDGNYLDSDWGLLGLLGLFGLLGRKNRKTNEYVAERRDVVTTSNRSNP
ncbi:WGxxGxxG family protein [Iningainema tapete]|uniref:WGxxGxxG-CTERM domain-containing protein n=1 Tax=Iningainema tapete BLCC-T55 TaxID=2748662 RepID=A0A8J7C5A7_9CYAN|nr:WGxxGxxG-CTERM domain-containing protein [Iningainema tapete BLCC-T55]